MTETALIVSDSADSPLNGSAPNLAPDSSNHVTDVSMESEDLQLMASPVTAKSAQPNPEIKIFISTFFTIFLAELGDKTQLTTLLMVAGTRSPWVIFLGAGSALVLTTLIGVLLGRWIATKISPRTLETSAGAMLLLIAVLLLWDVVNL